MPAAWACSTSLTCQVGPPARSAKMRRAFRPAPPRPPARPTRTPASSCRPGRRHRRPTSAGSAGHAVVQRVPEDLAVGSGRHHRHGRRRGRRGLRHPHLRGRRGRRTPPGCTGACPPPGPCTPRHRLLDVEHEGVTGGDEALVEPGAHRGPRGVGRQLGRAGDQQGGTGGAAGAQEGASWRGFMETFRGFVLRSGARGDVGRRQGTSGERARDRGPGGTGT